MASLPPAHAHLSGGALALLTLGLALGTFMEVLDTSIANVALPTIAGNLGVATSQGTWVISSYSIASAIAVPLTGWLARRVGEVQLFISSVLLFTLFSILCGVAPNFESLIVFRLMQGLVSGPMIPLSQTILLRSYPPDKQGLALGLWAMTVIVAPICGPLLGGWITDNYTWPWIFLINAPVGLFSACTCFILLRGQETATVKQRIDAVGLALLVIGIGSLQMMLDLGKDHDWFHSNFIVILAITAAVSLTFMLVWELTEKAPIIDLSLFKRRNFWLGTLIISLGYMTFFSSAVIFPLWLQTVMDYPSQQAGFATALIGVFALFLSPIIGRNLHKMNLRAVACCGFLVFATTAYINSKFTLDMAFSHMVWPRLIQGIGIACFFVPMTTITLSGIEPAQMASAAGLTSFFRTLSGAIGTALSATFWENDAIYHHARLSESITPYSAPTTAFLSQLNAQGLTGQAAVANIDQLITQQAYMMATNDFFWFSSLAFVALAIVVWLTRPKDGEQGAAVH